MSKKYWFMLEELFTKHEDIKSEYESLYNVVSKVIQSISLSDELEKVNKELQELSKEN